MLEFVFILAIVAGASTYIDATATLEDCMQQAQEARTNEKTVPIITYCVPKSEWARHGLDAATPERELSE